jgi:hypothetical protein
LEAEIEQRAQKDRASEEPASHHGSTTQPNQVLFHGLKVRTGSDFLLWFLLVCTD